MFPICFETTLKIENKNDMLFTMNDLIKLCTGISQLQLQFI